MHELSPYYTNSIHRAVDHPLWSDIEKAEMIARHELRERKALVRRYAGQHLELTGGE